MQLKQKLIMFCVPSQNYQHCFEKKKKSFVKKKIEASCSKFPKKLKNGIKILVSQAILE